jgi:uncharacterized protein YwgA
MKEASLGWLMDHLGISAEAVKKSFDARFRLQKAAFLMKCLGIRPFTDFGFGLYIHGPYSSRLALEYYTTEKTGGTSNLGLEEVSALDWFMSHESGWIELASGILSLRSSNKGMREEELLSTLRLSKPWVTKERFSDVLVDLSKHELTR